jgi:disulfide bond formation protein DsbB
MTPESVARKDRIVFAALALVSLAACVLAYALQHGSAALQPCPYCVLQRYAYVAIFVLCVVGFADGSRARIHAALVAAAALGGVLLAGYQVAKGATMTSCRVDPVGEFVNGLPMAAWWPDYLAAEGSCADGRAAVLGIPLPLASLLLFIVILGVAAWRAFLVAARAPAPTE